MIWNFLFLLCSIAGSRVLAVRVSTVENEYVEVTSSSSTNDVVVVAVPGGRCPATSSRTSPICGFEFPVDRPDAYAVFRPLKPMSLSAWTLDFRMFMRPTSGVTDPHVFSYHDNHVDFQFRLKPDDFGMAFQSQHYKFPYTMATNRWTRVTMRWDGVSGDGWTYVDAQLVNKKRNVKKGFLPEGGAFVVGQEQDAKEGNFQRMQRFVGKVANFRIWDQVLDDDQLQGLWGNSSRTPFPPPTVFDDPPTYTFQLKKGAKAIVDCS